MTRVEAMRLALGLGREAARGVARYLWPGDCVGGKATTQGEGGLTGGGVRLGHELEEGDG